MGGGGDCDFFCANVTARRLDAVNPTVRRTANARYRTVLDDINAACSRRAGITPRHRIVAHHPAPFLQRRPNDRVAGL